MGVFLFIAIVVLAFTYLGSLSLGCSEGLYWKYLEERSPAFRKMGNGKYIYVFLVWLTTPIWLIWQILFGLLTAVVDFCGAVFDFGNAFRPKANAQLDFETLKREIEEMTK